MRKTALILICFLGACSSSRNLHEVKENPQSQTEIGVLKPNTTVVDDVEKNSLISDSNSTSAKQSSDNDGVNRIGVLVSAAAGNNRNAVVRLKAYKDLNVNYVRQGITISKWNGSNPFYESLQSQGFKILLNADYYSQGGGPQPFPTDLEEYKRTLNNVLTKYKPEIVVIENEEYNRGYHTGTMQQYINELEAAIEVAHLNGLKVTNGGLTGRLLTLLVWRDYMNRGLKHEAEDFAKRAIPPDIQNALPNIVVKRKNFAEGMKSFDTLLDAYKRLNLDYVNFHWYEPIIHRTKGVKVEINESNFDSKALSEVVEYLRRRTGKSVITNEIGQLNESPAIVRQTLQKCLELKLPYIIWYSGDGGEGKAVALTNYDGSLRENGKIFKEFVSFHK